MHQSCAADEETRRPHQQASPATCLTRHPPLPCRTAGRIDYRYRSVLPFIGCRKIIHHPCPPFFRLRGSLRGCRSEIGLLDLSPATILCAKDCWVKIREGVVAPPPFIFWVSHEIVAGRHLPVSPHLTHARPRRWRGEHISGTKITWLV